jgi:predicted transcriptional regulator
MSEAAHMEVEARTFQNCFNYAQMQGLSKLVEEIEYHILNRLIEEGLCQAQIATRLCASGSGISHKLKRYGLHPKQRTKEMRNKVLELHKKGLRGFQIAGTLGLERQYVYNRLRDLKELGYIQ